MPRAPSRPVADSAILLQEALRTIAADPHRAVMQARAAVRHYPGLARAQRVLAMTLRAQGNVAEAERAELRAVEIGLRHPAVVAAQQALDADRLEEAEQLIRHYLRENPEDAGGALILGTVAERLGASKEAENLFRRALLLTPAYDEARIAIAKLYKAAGRFDEALTVLDEALDRDSGHRAALALKAGLLVQSRRLDEADTVFKRMLRIRPDDGRGWMNYAHLLKTMGRIDETVQAYRRSLAADPLRGIAWWGLANLKSLTLDAADVAAMRKALAGAIEDDDRIHLNFALGKALGDLGDFAGSFEHYREGNRIRLARAPHDPERVHANVKNAEKIFTPAFFGDRAGQGCQASDPIFIVSMPRSGSTLIEQILASHPMIEGTEELHDIERIALNCAPGEPAGGYLDKLRDMGAAKLRMLGQQYIESTRRHRKTDRPHFTDKMPSNWVFTGLIHLILPNAKIIDVRRHPMACGFANFAQHYNWGINFSYDLDHIGKFYSDYVRLMAHFDRTVPGLVHRVVHEELVADLEGEVRRLLAYLGLPFDPACLRFHETRRAVHTPSSEQVRQPVNRKGFDTWRNYEPWLGPLKDALGEVLDRYPRAPG